MITLSSNFNLILAFLSTKYIIYIATGVILLIAFMLYRHNHRMQTKAATYMNSETAVYNKKGIEKFLDRKARKFQHPSIIIVELRNLGFLYSSYSKRTNLMRQIADFMLEGLDRIEVVGRPEQNKFAIIVDNRSKDELKEICLHIQEKLDNYEIEDYGKYSFFVYFGVYENADLDDELVMFSALSIIKYSTVRDGNIYYYTEEIRKKVIELNQMNDQRQAALDQNQFVSYIQPKVELKTGKVVGGEILCRWLDENGEVVHYPSDFVPLFEANGFVSKIDELMLHNACKLAQTLVNRGKNDIVISVNCSKIKFFEPDFEKSIMDIVSKYNISPKNIEIEITESTVMENFTKVSQSIMSLRQLGFNVAMDDFGKELSSLGSLQNNPFDTIKLDMIFFSDRLKTEKSKQIVRNLTNMLKKLNFHIVCEGVEDMPTLDTLATICQDVIIQGYVISRPIPINQFEAFLDTKYEFNYEPIKEVDEKIIYKEALGDGSNVYSNGQIVAVQSNEEIEAMRRQMEQLKYMLKDAMDEQRRKAEDAERQKKFEDEDAAHRRRMEEEEAAFRRRMAEEDEARRRRAEEDERKRLQDEIDRLKREKNGSSNDDQIRQLREEFERQRLQDEINRLRNNQNTVYYQQQPQNPTIVTTSNNDDLSEIWKQIAKLREEQKEGFDKTQEGIEKNKGTVVVTADKPKEDTSELDAKIEDEKKLKAELESLLAEIKEANKMSKEELQEEERLEQEEADSKLNLEVVDDSDDSDSDDEYEEDEDGDGEVEGAGEDTDPRKPAMSLSQLEEIMQYFKEQFGANWNTEAKRQLKDGYYEVINGLEYYKGGVKRDMKHRIKHASKEQKQLYNIVKNEIMQYNGVANKMTVGYDCFYINKQLVAKVAFSKTKVRVYLALDPNEYNTRQFPHKDVSGKKVHAKTPFYMMLKSNLSVKRFKNLMDELTTNNNVRINPSYKQKDYTIQYRRLED